MKILVKDTGNIETLRLLDDEGNNIVKEFIKHHACKISGADVVGISNALKFFGCSDNEMTQSDFNEWKAILETAKEAMLARETYLAVAENEIHPVVERELEANYPKQFGYDSKFGLKNVMDAELAIMKRLGTGIVCVKNPVDNKKYPSGPNTSKNLKIPHFRHTRNSKGDNWRVQLHGDFIMTMPDPEDSFEFKAGIEFGFQKSADGKIRYIDDDSWLFPFSMGFWQELAVIDTFRIAAMRNFIALGIEGGVSLTLEDLTKQPPVANTTCHLVL